MLSPQVRAQRQHHTEPSQCTADSNNVRCLPSAQVLPSARKNLKLQKARASVQHKKASLRPYDTFKTPRHEKLDEVKKLLQLQRAERESPLHNQPSERMRKVIQS